MKSVTFLSFSAHRGGAALAASRAYAIVKPRLVHSAFLAIEKPQKANAPSPFPVAYPGVLAAIVHKAFWILSHLLGKLQQLEGAPKISLNLFGSRHMQQAIVSAEFLHVHWINNESLAITDFPLLSGKSVITLHDEWFYCGAEHHAYGEKAFSRVTKGYHRENSNVRGLDINRQIWKLKAKVYPKLHDVIFTVPSQWMRTRALQSVLLQGRDIRVVPNPIDTDLFQHDSRRPQRALFPAGSFIIAFGAINGSASYLKGFDLLEQALQILQQRRSDVSRIKLLVFGSKHKGSFQVSGLECIQLGHIGNPHELAGIYSSADITLVPSRVESFGQVAAESMSCETPVVAFRSSGLMDIVSHLDTGFLAEPFDTQSLASGIEQFLNHDSEIIRQIGANARKRIIQQFSNEYVRDQLLGLYSELELRCTDNRIRSTQ